MSFLIGVIGMLASLYIIFHSWALVPEDNAAVFLIFVGMMLFVALAGIAMSDFAQSSQRKKRGGKKE